jgi:cell fate regulator YaaT (PSP1 superfamily)
MERSYLIRYGLTRQVGRFAADAGVAYERGQTVVVRSHRGTELGDVLLDAPERTAADVPPAGSARVLRAAGLEDVELARLVDRERDNRFDSCQRVFLDGVWPIELIDVEPLLDDRRTVLHYLGPHRLDVTGVLAALRAACDLDVMLQPVGRDVPEEEDEDATVAEAEAHDDHGCGSCGTGGGCGSSGGCGSGSTSGAGGGSDCGVKKLLAARR